MTEYPPLRLPSLPSLPSSPDSYLKQIITVPSKRLILIVPMADPFYYEKLSMLNHVYHHTLVPYPSATLPGMERIVTPLYPHQRTLVHHMRVYSETMREGVWAEHQAVYGKVGIVGDGIGSGKTLSVLAYLASLSAPPAPPAPSAPSAPSAPLPQPDHGEITPHSSRFFYSHPLLTTPSHPNPNPNPTPLSANLVIVPHSLFHEWRQEIQRHTTLPYVAIETRRMLRGDALPREMSQSSFVLTTNKCYKYVHDYAQHHHIQWNQVFIDEASSLYMNSSDPPLTFRFLWLITHQWIPLLFKSASFHRASLYHLRSHVSPLHPELEEWLATTHTLPYEATLVSSGFLKEYLSFHHPLRYRMVLRNAEPWIRENLALPAIESSIIRCRANVSLPSLMSYMLSRNLQPTIQSHHIPHLYQTLGIPFQTVSEYLPYQPPLKYPLIQRMMDENECVICFERCEYPTMVGCCYHLYCGKCLLKSILISGKCPTCRDAVSPARMVCFAPLLPIERIHAKNKSEVCLEWIRNHPSGRFLIYSAFDNVFYQLFEEIDRMGRKAERTENNLFSLLRSIRNFKTGATQILFLSNVDVLRGLSFPFVTHLIFYHDLPSYEKKSLLIQSAHRVGRAQPLHVIQLHSEIPMER